MIKKTTAKLFAVTALFAAATGYLAGILTAPKSGKETRADIARNAEKVKAESEKQLKKLHQEVGNLLKEADEKTKNARIKVSEEFNKALKEAKEAKVKSGEVISALKSGKTSDSDLSAAVKELRQAKIALLKFLKK